MIVEITNLTNEKIDKAFLARVNSQTQKFIGRKKIKDISVVFVNARKIQAINKKYRRQNKPTDVLSFEEINEIFICPVVVRKQAKLFKNSFKAELTRVLIHGILHLAGFDHEKNKKEARKMKEMEDKIKSAI